MIIFFFKKKTAYDMRISDWSSDVCSSDLVDRQGQGLIPLERGELLRRQQVVVEVSKLPRALDPYVAGAQGVLQLGQGADFVETPVEAFRGDHQRFPAGLDEGRGCIGRHLTQVVGVHLA